MSKEQVYTINEIIKDAGIARSTFDKFADSRNLRPVKIEKRGKKVGRKRRSTPTTRKNGTMKSLICSKNRCSNLNRLMNNWYMTMIFSLTNSRLRTSRLPLPIS